MTRRRKNSGLGRLSTPIRRLAALVAPILIELMTDAFHTLEPLVVAF